MYFLNKILSSTAEKHGYSKSLEEYKREKLAAFKKSAGYDIAACVDWKLAENINALRGPFKRCDYESFSKFFFDFQKFF